MSLLKRVPETLSAPHVAATTAPKTTSKAPATTAAPTAAKSTTSTVFISSIVATTATPRSVDSTLSLPASAPSNKVGLGSGSMPSQTPSSNMPHTGLIAGVAAGALVLVVFGAGFFFRSKKKRGREAKEAELYQQRTMMHKYSEGGSALGYGDDSDFPLHQQQQQQQQQKNRQPDWFSRKSPLEYYAQVPPLEELKRQQQETQLQVQQQEQQQRPYPLTHEPSNVSSNNNASNSSSSSGPFAQQGAPMATRSLVSSSVGRPAQGEIISVTLAASSVSGALIPNSLQYQQQPHLQQQYQHPRVGTADLWKPSASVMSPTSSATSRATGPNNGGNTPGIMSPSPTYQGSSSTCPIPTNSLLSYTPPPPSFEPFTPISPFSSQPPAGFYDLLDDCSNIELAKMPSSRKTTGPTSPTPQARPAPRIPRDTRPLSVSSVSSFKLTSTKTVFDASAPDVPDVPAISPWSP